VFFWLFILIGNEIGQDSTVVDSIKKYEVPEIVDFTRTSVFDNSLDQTWVIEPILFFTGFKEFVYFTPYLTKDKGYAIDMVSPYPVEILLHSHPLNDYLIEHFNFVSLPINFLNPIKLNKGSVENFNTLEINTKVNTYDEPYSYLYFTMFGGNTIYNLDFTRAISNDAGFYLSGLYSRQYKNSDQLYLRTNAGYANFYYNQFVPSRVDVIITNNNYDTLSTIDFSDITITAGNDFYKIALFRIENKLEYLDTLSSSNFKNRLTTYGTNQRVLFSFKNFENIFGLDAATSSFKYDISGSQNNNNLEFYQRVNYNIHRLTVGLGYQINDEPDKNIYFNSQTRLKYDIFDNFKIFGRLNLFHKRANFVALYGNENVLNKKINIIGNPNIKDEKYFHKEIGFQIRNSMLSFYHSAITNQIVYRRDSTNYYSAVNIDQSEIVGFESFFEIPVWKCFSAGGVFNYLLKAESSSTFPKTNLKFWLNWQRKTERSVVCFFTRFNYTAERNDLAGNHYVQFWTISPGLMVKFITLRLGMILDNMLDKRAADFPNMESGFSLEIKWEFWD